MRIRNIIRSLLIVSFLLAPLGIVRSQDGRPGKDIRKKMHEGRLEARKKFFERNGEERDGDFWEDPREKCRVCSGKGSILIPCRVCSGTGHCQACDGKGQRGTSMTRGTVDCLVCRGTGKCKACNGTGGPRKPCEKCGSSGYLDPPATNRPAPPVAPVSPTPQPDTPAPAPVPAPEVEEPSGGGIGDYMDTMRNLQAQYKERQITTADFRDVTRSPSSYTGKVLRSEVYVLEGNPRGIVAGTAEYPPSNEMRMIVPHHRDIGNLVWVFMEKGSGVRKATITYGVQSAENFVLFYISAPSSGSTPAGS